MADELIVYAELTGPITGEVRALRGELDETTGAARRVGAAGEVAGRGLTDTERGALRARRATQDLHRGLLGLSRDLGGHVYRSLRTGATAFGVLTGAVGAFGLKSASSLQLGRIQLEATTGSAREAARVFEFLTRLDPKAPFDIGELQQTAVALANVNLQGGELERKLQGIVDVASATTDPSAALPRISRAVSQMHSANVILAEELNQLVDAGVAVGPALEQAYGMSLAEFRRRQQSGDQGLDPEAFFQALFGMRAGTAERVSTETLTGVISGVRSRLTMRFADEANPLVQSIMGNAPAIEAAVGGLVDTIGPPIFGLLGDLAETATDLLPLIGPPVGALADGLGLLLRSAGPGLRELTPLSRELAGSIGGLAAELVPVIPQLVDGFITLVGILPEAVELTGKLAVPLIRLVDTTLDLVQLIPGADYLLGGLLLTLLGYRQLSGLATLVRTFGGAVGFAGTQAQRAGVQAATAQGQFRGLGRIAGAAGAGFGGFALGQAIGAGIAGNDSAADRQFSNTVGRVGGYIATGAALGGPVGAAVGTGVGILDVGAQLLFGDPVVPGRTLAGHRAAAGTNGLLRITSGQRNWGLRSTASGHLDGTAVDVAGPGLLTYVQRARSMGHLAVMEGVGSGLHVHHEIGDPPRPAGVATMPAGGAGVLVAGNRYDINITGGTATERAALRRLLVELEDERVERAYRRLRGGR